MALPDITQLIDESYAAEKEPKTRQYIGASGIGGKCDAELAFSHRGFPGSPPDPQLKRIFKAGHRIEDWVIADMKKAGVNVMERYQLTGYQYAYNCCGGHVVGHADGVVEFDDADPALLEVKSMNLDRFNKYKKNGVKYSHPNYYSQVQLMMGMGGFKHSLFIAYCKNNSRYHHEYIEFDEFAYLALIVRAEMVMRGEAKRCATDMSDGRCKGCFKFDAWWTGLKPEPDCVNCKNAEALTAGGWTCHAGHVYGELCDDYHLYNPRYRDD